VVCALLAAAAQQMPTLEQLRKREEARDKWQQTSLYLDVLQAQRGAHIADIGAGLGYFTSRLATAVGRDGRVFAVEVDARRRVSRTPHDPLLANESIDSALILVTFHSMTEPKRMLAALKRALRPGGRLVISEDAASKRFPDGSAMSFDGVKDDLREAGFEIVDAKQNVVLKPWNLWMIVARRQ
jgi:predicted methyltransferase